MEYTDYDVKIAIQAYKAVMADIDEYDGPEIAVFSFGYGEIWADGDVTAHGRVVFKVNEDGEVQ